MEYLHEKDILGPLPVVAESKRKKVRKGYRKRDFARDKKIMEKGRFRGMNWGRYCKK